MAVAAPVKWHRVEPGWYETEHDGHKYELVNMRGQSVLWSGSMTPCWQVRIDGQDHPNTYFTMGEAKAMLRKRGLPT